MTWSCYGPGPGRCLACKACMRWAVALRVNGLDVELPNESVITGYLSRLHLYEPDRQWAILMALRGGPRQMMAVDIDGLLTHESDGIDYECRTPREDTIERLRQLYDSGRYWVLLYTARSESDRVCTRAWLDRHDIRRHGLLMSKPPVHVYVDDRATTAIGEAAELAAMFA